MAYPKTTNLVQTSPSVITLSVGNSDEALYTLTPSDAMPLKWRSANSAIATVDDGVIAAVKKGVTYVYGEVKDGARVGKVTVRVNVIE